MIFKPIGKIYNPVENFTNIFFTGAKVISEQPCNDTSYRGFGQLAVMRIYSMDVVPNLLDGLLPFPRSYSALTDLLGNL